MSDYETTCKTKKGRILAALRIRKALEDAGAEVTIGQEFDQPSEISWSAIIGSYRVFGDIDGKSHVGAFLAHWHTLLGTKATYPKTFGKEIGGSINTFHYSKATGVYDTLEELIEKTVNGITFLKGTMK